MNGAVKVWSAIVILTAALFCCLSALAAGSGTCGEQLTWTVDDEGLLTISGTGAMADYPEEWSNPAEWRSAKAAVIGSGVTYIGDFAFRDCTALTGITIGDGLTGIGMEPFHDCDAVIYASFGSDTAETLSRAGYAFRVPGSVYSLKYLYTDGVRSGLQLTAADRELREISIPAGITAIGAGAFRDCVRLTDVTIPGTVTSIGDDAFYGCAALTDLVIPDSVTAIGAFAFAGCSGLSAVTIPASVTRIGDQAFASCYGLNDVAFLHPDEAAVLTFGDRVFNNIGPTICCYMFTAVDRWAEGTGFPLIYLDGTGLDDIRSVTLPGGVRLICGASRTLKAFTFPDTGEPVRWSSSDPAVASVNDGVVTAHTAGRALITASVGAASAGVTVEAYIPATDFRLSETEVWLTAKKQLQLSAVGFEPAGASAELVWTSSDEDLATVDAAGLLTTMFPGDVTVMATSETGLSRACLVHLCYPVTAVAFDAAELTMLPGASAQLLAHVTMRTQSCVNHLVTFSSSDPAVAVVDENGRVTAIRSGTAVITAMAENGCSAACAVTVADGSSILVLPDDVVCIDAEAFAELGPGYGVVLSGQVTDIAPSAFAGTGITIIAPEGSYAADWAQNSHVPLILR